MAGIPTILSYGFFAAVILFGLHTIGIRESMAPDSNEISREDSMPIRGIAAIGVVLHHISQYEFFQIAGEMRLFVNAGFLFVAIFFFLSGYGLIKSVERKADYLNGFFRRRLPAVMIPYYLSVVFCTVIALFNGTSFTPVQWVTNTLGLTTINQYAWYPIILTILYVAFYFVFRKEKNRKESLIRMFLVILLLILVYALTRRFDFSVRLTHPGEWWTGEMVHWFAGHWWVNSAIAFWVGLFVASHEQKVRAFLEKAYFGKLVGCIALVVFFDYFTFYTHVFLGYWNDGAPNGPSILVTFLCLVLQMPHVICFTVLIYMLTMKLRSRNRMTAFLGKLSLDIYLTNYMALGMAQRMLRHSFLEYGMHRYRIAYFLLVIVITAALTAVFHPLSIWMQNRLRRK